MNIRDDINQFLVIGQYKNGDKYLTSYNTLGEVCTLLDELKEEEQEQWHGCEIALHSLVVHIELSDGQIIELDAKSQLLI